MSTLQCDRVQADTWCRGTSHQPGVGMTKLREALLLRTAWLLATTSLVLGFAARLRVG
jgi:hypothetical protein